ncbi:OLC1v1021043C2 [Oldenlandia corymbosa var. corymbosa]|uniref:OLC1v1021043C2 n=1 Tax=Oldenlandia corymbosa var. corymbosa TaxID=529605 RepID=A0AAV1BUT7_OLDCO|nr:OLC1v1021043C2 [Oldenlandia corymbosa var. corymbosa]
METCFPLTNGENSLHLMKEIMGQSSCLLLSVPSILRSTIIAKRIGLESCGVCFFCRFTFVISFLLLLTGAALNDQHGEENMYFNYYYCYVVKPGVFAGAAVLSLASVALGLIYYITLTSMKNVSNSWGGGAPLHGGGIAMGQPQFPPQNAAQGQAPVFVHEDTYMRRQLA